jgi:hypothetical protein
MKAFTYIGVTFLFAQFAYGANDHYCKTALPIVESSGDWSDAIPQLSLKEEGASYSLPLWGAGALKWVSSTSENDALYLSRPLGSKNPQTGRPGMDRSSEFAITKIKSEEASFLVSIGSSYNAKMPEGVNFPIHHNGTMKMKFKNGVCFPTVIRGATIEKCTAALKKISYVPSDDKKKWPQECLWYESLKDMWADKSLNLLKQTPLSNDIPPVEEVPSTSGNAT